MKKLSIIFLTIILMISMCSCEKSKQEVIEEKDESTTNVTTNIPETTTVPKKQSADVVSVNKNSSPLEKFSIFEDNPDMPFSISDNAKKMLENQPELFEGNSNEDIEESTDSTLEYKHLIKNISKYGNKLICLNDAYVLNIEEFDVNDITYSILHLIDNDDNSFYVYSLCEYDDIFQEDIVNCYALPMATSSFDNVGGGTTNVIVLAGAYIEKTNNAE